MSEETELLKLQNGSDVRGVAIEGVAGESVNLTPAAANRIASGFLDFLAGKLAKPKSELKIFVGHDSRISAQALTEAVLTALTADGAQAVNCSLASTPAMFMTTVFEETKADGAIMLTASHLPFNRNGLKFFTADGGLESADIRALLEMATDKDEQTADIGSVPKFDLISLYAAHLCAVIRRKLNLSADAKPLTGMKIVVDAGNGAGGFFADKILAALGADTRGSQFLEPDGHFPNHIPNPENKEAMAALKNAVLANKADLGLIFDTDVDRMGAVLHSGEEIGRNALIAMMAAILAPEYPHSTIVTDSVTSDELTEFLTAELGLVHHRFKRGYRNVINECIRLNKSGTVSPLAIETSGHGALSENYYLDDGAYLAVMLLVAAAKARQENRDLAELIAKLKHPAESREYRLKIIGQADPKAYGEQVLKKFAERAEDKGIKIASPSYEGVRLVFDEGWALLRMSLHDPNMPLNVESRRAGDCEKLARRVSEMLSDFTSLDRGMLAS